MATLYFNSSVTGGGYDNDYSNPANYWSDSAFTVPWGNIPTSSDDVLFYDGVYNDSGGNATAIPPNSANFYSTSILGIDILTASGSTIGFYDYSYLSYNSQSVTMAYNYPNPNIGCIGYSASVIVYIGYGLCFIGAYGGSGSDWTSDGSNWCDNSGNYKAAGFYPSGTDDVNIFGYLTSDTNGHANVIGCHNINVRCSDTAYNNFVGQFLIGIGVACSLATFGSNTFLDGLNYSGNIQSGSGGRAGNATFNTTENNQGGCNAGGGVAGTATFNGTARNWYDFGAQNFGVGIVGNGRFNYLTATAGGVIDPDVGGNSGGVVGPGSINNRAYDSTGAEISGWTFNTSNVYGTIGSTFINLAFKNINVYCNNYGDSNCFFYGVAANYGQFSNPFFYDYSINYANTPGGAYYYYNFYNYSQNAADINYNSTVVFFNYSINNSSGIIEGTVSFYDSSNNLGTMTGTSQAYVYSPNPNVPMGGTYTGGAYPYYINYADFIFDGNIQGGSGVATDWSNPWAWASGGTYYDRGTALPSSTNSLLIVSDVLTDSSGNLNTTTYRNVIIAKSRLAAGLNLHSSGTVTLQNLAKNLGHIYGTTKLYTRAVNLGTITGNTTVYAPSNNPIGGTVTGTVTYVGYELINGVLACWHLDDDGSGNVSGADSSGNGYNLNVSGGVTLGPGIVGGAAVFPNSGGYNFLGPVTLAANSYLSWAVSVWAQWLGATGQANSQQIFFSSATDLGVQIYLHEDTGHLAVAMYGPVQGFDTGYVVPDYNWHNYVVTQDSLGNVTVYVDGVSVYSVSVTVGYISNYPTVLGSEATDYTQKFNGSLDEVIIWNRALLRSQIVQLFNVGRAIPYPFFLLEAVRPLRGFGNSGLISFD